MPIMKIDFLCNYPQFIPVIAQWYFDEWGYLKKDSTVLSLTQDLERYLNSDKVPLMLVALNQEEPLGAVQLKYREMSIYPDYAHWLGGVYVAKGIRGKDLAQQMIIKLCTVAKFSGVKKLYLQTEKLDGGLYTKLGWKAVEQVTYRGIEVLVMQKDLSA